MDSTLLKVLITGMEPTNEPNRPTKLSPDFSPDPILGKEGST